MKKLIALLLAVLLLLSMVACAAKTEEEPAEPEKEVSTEQTNEATNESEKKEPVTIKVYYSGDSSESGSLMEKQLLRFKEEYKDTINLELENTPDIDSHVQKIKMLFASGEYPDVFDSCGYDLTALGASNDAIGDFSPYLEADPEFKSWVSDTTLEFNTHDGKVTSIGSTVYGAMYYNKELFEQAGIEPAATWDEFWDNCEKLKAAGITPMCMDTKDTGWITGLFLGALIGSSSDAGYEFMHTYHPASYETPEFVDAIAQVQKCFQEYAPKNAIGANYDAGAASFLSGETAMMFNGPWMIGDFSDPTKAAEGLAEKIGVCPYPGNLVYAGGTSQWCMGNTSKEKMDAVATLVKYMHSPECMVEGVMVRGDIPDNPTVTLTDEQRAEVPLTAETMDAVAAAEVKIGDFQARWWPNVCDQLSVLYPALITNEITPEEFAAKLTETAAKNG